MVADHSEHAAANYFMHSGSGFQGRPSMGGWVTYGLGSECDNLPGFIVLESELIPPGGLDLFGSGFLPATYQGTLCRKGEHPIADLEPREATAALQQSKLNLLRTLNEGVLDRFGAVNEMEATIANYELAFRMQSEVPELVDLKSESEVTRKLGGLDSPDTEEFGRECPAHGGARRALRRTPDAGAQGHRPLGSARESGIGPSYERQGCRPAYRGAAQRSEGAWPARPDASCLGRRVRAHALRAVRRRRLHQVGRPRSQSVRLQPCGWQEEA